MENKQRVSFLEGSPWEGVSASSALVVVGDHCYLSAVSPVQASGEVVALADPYQQTKFTIMKIVDILNKQGFFLEDIVRLRLYVIDIGRWNEYTRALREFFDKVRPALTIFETARLRDPRFMLEIEAEAVKGGMKGEIKDL
ncbi:MAG TPA: Rid family hydrolase [Oligoflexia bacterium]|nr:Rid family hydrolase [Oligoflexia bacterium]HMP27517.1 Rid family hydrolase [Oligoflexia bacterium]